jgi:uncharacterized short protein YbdD (DUF466 family)
VSREDNRAKAPEAAKYIDHMREHFPDLTVLYVKEGTFERGTKLPEVTPCK